MQLVTTDQIHPSGGQDQFPSQMQLGSTHQIPQVGVPNQFSSGGIDETNAIEIIYNEANSSITGSDENSGFWEWDITTTSKYGGEHSFKVKAISNNIHLGHASIMVYENSAVGQMLILSINSPPRKGLFDFEIPTTQVTFSNGIQGCYNQKGFNRSLSLGQTDLTFKVVNGGEVCKLLCFAFLCCPFTLGISSCYAMSKLMNFVTRTEVTDSKKGILGEYETSSTFTKMSGLDNQSVEQKRAIFAAMIIQAASQQIVPPNSGGGGGE